MISTQIGLEYQDILNHKDKVNMNNMNITKSNRKKKSAKLAKVGSVDPDIELTSINETFFGQVDFVGSNSVEGWICSSQVNHERLTVVAMLDGREIVRAVANTHRQDLESANIGDGCYGFKLEISQNILKKKVLEIVEAKSLKVIKFGHVDKRTTNLNEIINNQPILLIDISDLIIYLEHHDNATGIQRVQVETITAMIDNVLLPTANIRFLAYSEQKLDFIQIPTAFVEELFDDIKKIKNSRKFKRKPNGRIDLDSYYIPSEFIVPKAQSEKMFLITLGASWNIPNYFVAVRRLKKLGVKFLSVLYDLIPIKLPNMCDKGTTEVFKIFLRKLVRNSDCVLGISQHTLLDFSEYCSSNNFIEPPTSLFKLGQSMVPNDSSLQKQYCPVQGDFILFVSTIEGRKNHKYILDIWKKLFSERGSETPTLVFVGRIGWRVEELVEELYNLNFINDKVIILSEISDEALKSLYHNCLFTVYPSLYEGWGLPVTESLAFGKVCLCSDRSSLPEAGKNHVVYFNIDDINDGFLKVERLVDEHSYRNSLEEKIRNDYIPVSWSESAESLIKVVNKFLNVRSSSEVVPVVDLGEYSFATIEYQTADSIIGQDVAQHLINLYLPKLTNQRLTIDSYIIAEECIDSGTWNLAENWGRWVGQGGASLSFNIKNPSINHMIIFDIRLPHFIDSLIIETKYKGKVNDVWLLNGPENLIQLHSLKYSSINEINIDFNVRSIVYSAKSEDDRNLTIGFSRFSVIPADSLEHRLIFLEKMLFKNIKSI